MLYSIRQLAGSHGHPVSFANWIYVSLTFYLPSFCTTMMHCCSSSQHTPVSTWKHMNEYGWIWVVELCLLHHGRPPSASPSVNCPSHPYILDFSYAVPPRMFCLQCCIDLLPFKQESLEQKLLKWNLSSNNLLEFFLLLTQDDLPTPRK